LAWWTADDKKGVAPSQTSGISHGAPGDLCYVGFEDDSVVPRRVGSQRGTRSWVRIEKESHVRTGEAGAQAQTPGPGE
jgi:hypothetical protein